MGKDNAKGNKHKCVCEDLEAPRIWRWRGSGNGEDLEERWGAGVETQKNVREEIGGWGRVPFNEPYAPLLSTIYDGAQGS